MYNALKYLALSFLVANLAAREDDSQTPNLISPNPIGKKTIVPVIPQNPPPTESAKNDCKLEQFLEKIEEKVVRELGQVAAEVKTVVNEFESILHPKHAAPKTGKIEDGEPSTVPASSAPANNPTTTTTPPEFIGGAADTGNSESNISTQAPGQKLGGYNGVAI